MVAEQLIARRSAAARPASPPRPDSWVQRQLVRQPPECAGRILLLLVACTAVLAHIPAGASAGLVAGLGVVILSALWIAGQRAYVVSMAAMLVQLPLPAGRAELLATSVAAALAVGVCALVRGLIAAVSAEQQAALRRQRERDDAERQARAEHERLTGAAQYWANHDRLTRVLNRTTLNAELAALAEAGSCAGLLVIAVAGFNTVNDALGASIGDELLAALASRLGSRARDSDVVARLGGDEFALLLPGLTAENADLVAGRFMQSLVDPFSVGPHLIPLQARCGLALDDGSFAQGPDELLRQACSAARGARVGATPTVSTGATYAETQAAMKLEADLHLALQRDEFFLLFQPLVSTVTGQIESVEALVRWQHPERGLVPPDAFIGAAESTGQILGIGIRVLELAVEQLRAWNGTAAASLTVAVNVSARQLAEVGFVEQVQALVWAAGVDPHRLILELTESLLVEDSDQAVAALWRLRGLGFRIALDDFGTGYSSLARLGELPLDELKIDKSFVDRLGVGPNDSTALVTAAIAMGRGLGLAVVAEGVESATQAARLTSLGCDLLQGYLLGRPQPAAPLLAQMGQRLLADPASFPAPRDEAAAVEVPRVMPDAATR